MADTTDARPPSPFAHWLYRKAWFAFGRRFVSKGGPVEWAESLFRLPRHAPLLDGEGRLLPRGVLRSVLRDSMSAEEDLQHPETCDRAAAGGMH